MGAPGVVKRVRLVGWVFGLGGSLKAFASEGCIASLFLRLR